MGSKWSAEIQMERKMFQVKMGFEFFQPDGSFNVNKEKPQEYCWYAKTFFWKFWETKRLGNTNWYRLQPYRIWSLWPNKKCWTSIGMVSGYRMIVFFFNCRLFQGVFSPATLFIEGSMVTYFSVLKHRRQHLKKKLTFCQHPNKLSEFLILSGLLKFFFDFGGHW